jgi:hypothetical protein
LCQTHQSSHGTTAFNLEEVLKDVKAKTCFILKKRDSVSYQRERFAFVSFSTSEAMNEAYKKGFVLKKNGLVFIPTSQRTCFTCGSPHHLQFHCNEKHQKENLAQKTSQFSSIYNRFHAKPSYPKGYTPSHNTGEWNEENETYDEYMRRRPILNENWDWDSVPLPTDKEKTKENLSYAQAARKPTNPPTTNKKPTAPSAKSSLRLWNFNNVQQHQTQSPPIFNLNSNKESTIDTRLTKLEQLFGIWLKEFNS